MTSFGSGLTFTGWMFIAMAVLSIPMAVGICRRLKPDKRPGLLAVGYIGLVVFVLATLTFGLSSLLIGSIHGMLTLPRYEARVVDHHSYVDTVTDTDSDGHTSEREVTMYQPVVVFTDAAGKDVRIRSDISSSSTRKLHSRTTVGYEAGMETAMEISWRKTFMMAGGGIMLLIMGYFVVVAVWYALGWSMTGLQHLGLAALVWCLIPLALLGMFGGLSYGVYRFFSGEDPDMPLWALCVCLFFAIVLFFAILGYFKHLLSDTR